MDTLCILCLRHWKRQHHFAVIVEVKIKLTFKPTPKYALQGQYRSQFFSIFYFSINAGALLSKFITPIFRADLNCYPGKSGPLFDECYAVAFGIPGLLMVVAVGKSFLYKRNAHFWVNMNKQCNCWYMSRTFCEARFLIWCLVATEIPLLVAWVSLMVKRLFETAIRMLSESIALAFHHFTRTLLLAIDRIENALLPRKRFLSKTLYD